MRIFDYIQEGGPIMYVLLVLNIIGVALMIAKFMLLMREQKLTTINVASMQEGLKTKTGSLSGEALIELIKQEIQSYMHGLEKGINTIKIIAQIAPLLGLLGTVVGVLMAFKVISQTGMSNPANFAEGISVALITTVGGLIVAIPHFIAHSYLLGYLDQIESTLERELISKVLK
ncbi:MAG: biopolymer transporter ExbB [Bdellovibrio sp. CG12_big_fil_rev_8_21_14_0_65_39_13]|nr:MAG: biopolymer transporter ExbB [Bdellovibrio sp. CG22_combo_CG10-13_8_21_14_all_39_27]PIQ61179.1 MAG: biopolymer transporter ExbB [Bdellovibrio sp. CG12_big_fil_rev_8_21_14_0_65_39_13]PIR34849.1 MAG: biopolymer transporter ExbB [Bdellovibrio sp. CG11_big_fil_rev_8_21_14_0_20_39_38]